MKLSVLDQLPVTKNNTTLGAVEKTIELAKLADELGYTRMWFAEHHGAKSYASSAPEILAAYVAAVTKKLRLGTGGTMMMHYSPLKMAEVFKTLTALAPGRIDFGAGRAPGGDQKATRALASGKLQHFDDLYQKFQTTLDLMRDQQPTQEIYQNIPVSPVGVGIPEAWMLGSSGNSALEAARLGVGYSFAQFFMGSMTREIFEGYRSRFEPSYYMESPQINVSYLVTVAEDLEEAEFEAGTSDIYRLRFAQGRISSFLTPEEAQEERLKLTEMDKMRIQEERRERHLVGTPKMVADQILNAGKFYGFDEAMIVSITHSQEKRLAAYRLLAKELL